MAIPADKVCLQGIIDACNEQFAAIPAYQHPTLLTIFNQLIKQKKEFNRIEQVKTTAELKMVTQSCIYECLYPKTKNSNNQTHKLLQKYQALMEDTLAIFKNFWIDKMLGEGHVGFWWCSGRVRYLKFLFKTPNAPETQCPKTLDYNNQSSININ